MELTEDYRQKKLQNMYAHMKQHTESMTMRIGAKNNVNKLNQDNSFYITPNRQKTLTNKIIQSSDNYNSKTKYHFDLSNTDIKFDKNITNIMSQTLNINDPEYGNLREHWDAGLPQIKQQNEKFNDISID